MFYSHEIASLYFCHQSWTAYYWFYFWSSQRQRGEGEQKDSHIVCISSKNCPELSFVYGAQVAIQKRVTLPKWDFPLCSSHWINTFFVPSYHSGEKDDVKQIGRGHNCLSCVKLFSKSIRNISRFSKKDSVYKKYVGYVDWTSPLTIGRHCTILCFLENYSHCQTNVPRVYVSHKCLETFKPRKRVANQVPRNWVPIVTRTRCRRSLGSSHARRTLS